MDKFEAMARARTYGEASAGPTPTTLGTPGGVRFQVTCLAETIKQLHGVAQQLKQMLLAVSMPPGEKNLMESPPLKPDPRPRQESAPIAREIEDAIFDLDSLRIELERMMRDLRL